MEKESIKKQVDYYNARSANYSEVRYPKITLSYTQYIFKKRLEIFLDFLERIEETLPENATILEIGCADGVVFKAIEEKFPGRFVKLVGIDVSPKMISEAKNRNKNLRALFFLRDEFKLKKFDLIIELGIHPYNLDGELNYVNECLNSKGYYFYSAVGRKSVFVGLKLRAEKYLNDYKSYKQYEQIFGKNFILENSEVYGLFIPKLWSVPFLGRLLQPIFDSVFSKIIPERLHEKIYCLRKLH